MEKVKKRLQDITEVWNSYVWTVPHFQKRIGFTPEVRTNYFGEITSFFSDTLDSLVGVNYELDFQKVVFQTIGILQIVYSQQDLVDEILKIYNLPPSLPQDKNPNRTIRNELIGHPISRFRDKKVGEDGKQGKGHPLKSSSFFDRSSANGEIRYVLYSIEKGYQYETKEFSIADILARHEDYLSKYLELIWLKILQIMREYKLELLKLHADLKLPIPFLNLLKRAKMTYPKVMRENELYTEKDLGELYRRRREHPRYQHALTSFIQLIDLHLTETMGTLDQYINPLSPEAMEMPALPTIEFVLADAGSIRSTAPPESLSYYFSKLYEDHPVWGINYFLKEFAEDVLVVEELSNMQHSSSRLEYCASYDYLEKIFQERKLL